MSEASQRPDGASDGGEPEYGVRLDPEYGAMASKFGPGYDPYLYGAPEPPVSDQASDGAASPSQAASAAPSNASYDAYGPGAYGQAGQSGPADPYGRGGWPGPSATPSNAPSNAPYGAPQYGPQDAMPPYPGQERGGAERPHRIVNGVDVDDPASNPLYGRWDPYAVIAFVFSILFSVPLLPALMGFAALWRTRTFHMRGRGLAVAAIVINTLTTIVQVWMLINGVDVADLTSRLLDMYAGSGSGDDGTLSA